LGRSCDWTMIETFMATRCLIYTAM
jgi:hypothetical protein